MPVASRRSPSVSRKRYSAIGRNAPTLISMNAPSSLPSIAIGQPAARSSASAVRTALILVQAKMTALLRIGPSRPHVYTKPALMPSSPQAVASTRRWFLPTQPLLSLAAVRYVTPPVVISLLQRRWCSRVVVQFIIEPCQPRVVSHRRAIEARPLFRREDHATGRGKTLTECSLAILRNRHLTGESTSHLSLPEKLMQPPCRWPAE